MKRKNVLYAVAFAAVTVIAIPACHKNDDSGSTDVTKLKTDILADAANTVIVPSYTDLSAKAGQVLSTVQALNTTTNDANLTAARAAWQAIRQTWEQSEAWLIGPVESDNIDPRIDTWPVDFNSLDSILNTSNTLDEAYVNDLDDALKGFHPIEYLLWGQDGNKAAADFTAREKEFLLALAQNLNTLCSDVKASWTGGYANSFATAGTSGNATYPTTKSAYEALVDGMSGICEEVANGKMKEPFDAPVGEGQQFEESPFAKNSMIDFTNNIQGILKMYQGQFTSDGKGVEDLVRNYNLSLDNEIKTKHAAAITAMNAVTDPFGEATVSQRTQISNAMDKINDLLSTLDTKLKPFVQQYGAQ
ncbi:MAG: imelysin family protein [Chitinophagaceae bacterium]